MLQQPEKEEERRDLRWFPATKEEDCRVKQDFDEEVVIKFYILWTSLKGQCHEIFDFWFFHESRISFPQAP
jgi:hypothetical protein